MWTESKMPETHTDVQDLPEGYRMTELGPVPEEWRVVRLGEMVGLRKSTLHPSEVPDARYIGLEHLISGEIYIKQFDRASVTRSAK